MAAPSDLTESLANVVEDLMCAVCFDLNKDPSFFATPGMTCWHSFCYDKCATKLKTNRCPLCSAEFSAVGRNHFALILMQKLNEQRLQVREKDRELVQTQQELGAAKEENGKLTLLLNEEILKNRNLSPHLVETQDALARANASLSEANKEIGRLRNLNDNLDEANRNLEEELRLKDEQIERLKKINVEERRQHGEEIESLHKNWRERLRDEKENWQKEKADILREAEKEAKKLKEDLSNATEGLSKANEQITILKFQLLKLEESKSAFSSDNYLCLRQMTQSSLNFSRLLIDKIDTFPDNVEHSFNEWNEGYAAHTRALSSSFFLSFNGPSTTMKVGELYRDSKSYANISWEPLGLPPSITGTSFKSTAIVKNSIALTLCAKRVPKERNFLSVFREAHILWRSCHPFIIRLDGLGYLADSDFSLVFIHCRFNLENALVSRWDLSDKIARPIFYGILSALKYLHDHDVVHRCVTSFSVLIEHNENSVKLAGFSHARSLHSLPFRNTYEYITRDTISKFHPTELRFFAPELTYYSDERIPLTGEGWKAADVWAAGCVFGEMLQNTSHLLYPPSSLHPVENLYEILKYTELKPTQGEEGMTQMFPLLQNAKKEGERESVSLAKKMEDVYGQPFSPVRKHGVDLMLRMMKIFAYNRIGVDDALKHPYFANFRHPLINFDAPIPVSLQEKKEFSDENLLKFCKMYYADIA